MKTKNWLIVCALAALAVSCDGGKESRSNNDAAETPASLEVPAEFKAESDLHKEGYTLNLSNANHSITTVADKTISYSATKNNASQPGQVPVQSVPVKKLIKNGTLRMEVDDYMESRKKINALIPKFDAYIGGENETNDGNKISGTITIRVPFNKFDGLLDAVSGEGEYISDKTVNVDDVTAEYVDLSARLKTKLEVEDRYRDILKKAHKIPDILSVENELRVIREEIEAAQGRMKYINDQATYSTLSVEMYEVLPYSTPPQAGFFSNIAEAFVNGWNGLLGFLVGLIRIWPFLLFLAVALFFLRRFWKRSAA